MRKFVALWPDNQTSPIHALADTETAAKLAAAKVSGKPHPSDISYTVHPCTTALAEAFAQDGPAVAWGFISNGIVATRAQADAKDAAELERVVQHAREDKIIEDLVSDWISKNEADIRAAMKDPYLYESGIVAVWRTSEGKLYIEDPHMRIPSGYAGGPTLLGYWNLRARFFEDDY